MKWTLHCFLLFFSMSFMIFHQITIWQHVNHTNPKRKRCRLSRCDLLLGYVEWSMEEGFKSSECWCWMVWIWVWCCGFQLAIITHARILHEQGRTMCGGKKGSVLMDGQVWMVLTTCSPQCNSVLHTHTRGWHQCKTSPSVMWVVCVVWLLCWASCGCGALLWRGRMGWCITITCWLSEHASKQMARVGLSGVAPWHGVAWLVHDHHSTHMAKVELESGWMCLNTTPTQPPSQATFVGCEPLPCPSSYW